MTFLCCTRYGTRQLSLLSSGQKHFFFTILRDPVDAFESLFSYAGIGENLGGLDLSSYVRQLSLNKTFPRKPNLLGLNQQAWDLGINQETFSRPKNLSEKLSKLAQDFDLVMIAEKMDESLVLLANLLCLPLSQFTSLRVNARKEQSRIRLSEWERKCG